MSPPPIQKDTSPPSPSPPTAPSQPCCPIPTFSIRVDTLSHRGAVLFFNAVHPTTVLRDAVISSMTWLYTPKTVPTRVESILLVLRPMDGVAYTTGSDTHKEIHFSLDYIRDYADKPRRAADAAEDDKPQEQGKDDQRNMRVQNEVIGVITHEVVHCYQYDAIGTCPWGLIEGIADYVRLNAGYVPPHWRRTAGDKWDAGYQTTAYFLDWIEQRTGAGTIRRLNGCLKDTEYNVGIFEDITGSCVTALWELYCEEYETTNKAG